MQTFQADLAVIGAGGAGLRAAIAAAQANPNAKIALISKVYPMRSHTVAAEGGSAAVAQDHDSFEYHFHDTVAGGDWLCEQDVVDYFVHHCPTEMTQLEQWGCPWSRRPDGGSTDNPTAQAGSSPLDNGAQSSQRHPVHKASRPLQPCRGNGIQSCHDPAQRRRTLLLRPPCGCALDRLLKSMRF